MLFRYALSDRPYSRVNKTLKPPVGNKIIAFSYRAFFYTIPLTTAQINIYQSVSVLCFGDQFYINHTQEIL